MRTATFLLFFTIVVYGCKKDNSPASSSIYGTWELRQSSGTIAGVTKTFPRGNGLLLQFSSDNTYKIFLNFQQSNQGTYKLVKNSVTFAGQTYDGIYYDNSASGDFVILNSDSLIIGNTYPDGVTSSYVRQK